MKMLKWALLGGAAFAVTATTAQADELSDLKAQLETLQQRVTQLEAQPTTALPSGYSLMSFRSGGAVYDAVPEKADMRELTAVDNGFTIGVMPTADVAPVAEVTVSGEIRTILVYNGSDELNPKWCGNDYYEDFCVSAKEANKIKKEEGRAPRIFGSRALAGLFEADDDALDVQVRGRLVVTGKAETAVGEVGGRIRLQAGNPFDDDNSVVMNQAYAWWKFSPSWQLIAGLWDSTSAVQAGVDWDFTGPGFTGLLGDDGSTEQMRLVFNNGGPLTFAIALEDSEGDDLSTAAFSNPLLPGYADCFARFTNPPINTAFITQGVCYSNRGADTGDIPAVAGYIAYDAEGVFLQLTGLWEQDKREATLFTGTYASRSFYTKGFDDNWFVGAGARFGLGDVATLTAAAWWGEGYQDAVYTLIGPDDQYWGASLGILANVGEASRIEIGGAYFRNKDAYAYFLDESWQATAGWFWDPVSQVTVFVTGSYAWNQYSGGCHFADPIVSNRDGCDWFDGGDDISVKSYSQDSWQALFGTTLRF